MIEKDEILIQEYAAGLLSGQSLDDFEQRILSEPALKEELDLYLVLKAIDNQRLKKNILGSLQSEVLVPQKPAAAYGRIIGLIGLLLVGLAFMLYQVYKPESGKNETIQAPTIALKYLKTPYPSPVIAMGQDTLEKAVKEAYLSYRNKQFEPAARQLMALSRPTDEILFYTGEALVQLGQWEAALTYFGRIGPGYWREIADWRSALVLLQTRQTEKARKLLEQLKQGPRKTEAETLLEVL